MRRTNMVIFPKSATEEDGSDANSALDTVAGLTGAFDNMGQNDTGESTDSTEDTQSTTEGDTAEVETFLQRVTMHNRTSPTELSDRCVFRLENRRSCLLKWQTLWELNMLTRKI